MKKFSSLIGVPYKEKDCWAIVRDFYKLEFGITLQAYYNEIPTTREEAKELVYSSMKDFEEITGPRKFGDILLIKLYRIESHVAVYLGNDTILHTSEHSGCVIDRVSRWERMVVGTYRVKEKSHE